MGIRSMSGGLSRGDFKYPSLRNCPVNSCGLKNGWLCENFSAEWDGAFKKKTDYLARQTCFGRSTCTPRLFRARQRMCFANQRDNNRCIAVVKFLSIIYQKSWWSVNWILKSWRNVLKLARNCCRLALVAWEMGNQHSELRDKPARKRMGEYLSL